MNRQLVVDYVLPDDRDPDVIEHTIVDNIVRVLRDHGCWFVGSEGATVDG